MGKLKRSTLGAALQQVATGSETAPAPASIPEEPGDQHQKRDGSRWPVATTRIGKRHITIFVDPDLADRIKILAVKERKTVQELGLEALGYLFAARGMD